MYPKKSFYHQCTHSHKPTNLPSLQRGRCTWSTCQGTCPRRCQWVVPLLQLILLCVAWFYFWCSSQANPISASSFMDLEFQHPAAVGGPWLTCCCHDDDKIIMRTQWGGCVTASASFSHELALQNDSFPGKQKKFRPPSEKKGSYIRRNKYFF